MVKLQGTAPNQVPTNADLGSLAYVDHDNVNLTAADLRLKALSKTKSLSADGSTLTAVDVFIYDTSKDSDGGAWRKRTQHTSWYNEGASSTRGSRKEFPAVAVIVAEATQLTIYDGDDPSLPMWMVFPENKGALGGVTTSGKNLTSVAMLNGVLVGGYGNGLSYVNFLSEVLERGAQFDTANTGVMPFNVSERDQTPDGRGGTLNLQTVNTAINDVAMTVLPDAPTDPATGLPVPTIAVATDGGVSVIKDDGAVADSSDTNKFTTVDFNSSGNLITRNEYHGAIWAFSSYASDGFTAYKQYVQTSSPPYIGAGTDGAVVTGEDAFVKYRNHASGVQTMVAENTTTPANGMAHFFTSDYATGWMPGDIKLAALANSATADRSVNNNPLTQYGTITTAAVATGADVVGYSGFSSSNYLEQPNNSDLDFGTGDFCVMGWGSSSSAASRTFVSRGYTSPKWQIQHSSAGLLRGYIGSQIVSYAGINDGTWHHIAMVRSSGTQYLYVDGVQVDSLSNNTTDVTLAGATVLFGIRHGGINDLDSGKIALWRISATAPTADQIKKIYNDEKVLFQDSAKATLTGSSDAVTALAHDPATDLLHVGTSGGRSVFQGLRRVDETATAVTTAISAVDGLVVEQ